MCKCKVVWLMTGDIEWTAVGGSRCLSSKTLASDCGN